MSILKNKNVFLHKNSEMKKLIIIVVICLLTLLLVSLYYYNRWKPLWVLEEPKAFYSIIHHHDDTLRIVMIGDSWVGMRTDTCNNLFQARLSKMIDKPVKLKTKGKGGEKSRGVYQLMYEEVGFGTKPLLSEGANYCVVIAGINDAAVNLGKKQYVHHMQLIIVFLLANGIRPVLIEIPDVNIWNVYGGKPVKDLMVDYIKSLMTGCEMYHYHEYREALYSMLVKEHLLNQVVYVPMNCWNGEGKMLNLSLFIDDMIHLNHNGYEKLDNCIALAIANDLKQLQDSALVNYPMGKDAQ